MLVNEGRARFHHQILTNFALDCAASSQIDCPGLYSTTLRHNHSSNLIVVAVNCLASTEFHSPRSKHIRSSCQNEIVTSYWIGRQQTATVHENLAKVPNADFHAKLSGA